MGDLKKHFKKLALHLEGNYDELASILNKRLNSDKPLQIVTYRSYGTVNQLFVKGRVLRDKGLRKAIGKDRLWNNIVEMYKRFQSDEIAHARLRINFHGATYEVETNDEGYFSINLSTEKPIDWTDMWHEVTVELIDAPFAFSKGITGVADILVPPADAEYGIISDIDDTVVKTTATNFLAMARNTFFHNAHSRMPFAGVTEFYKSLQLGRNGKRNNPFFYVSSSPWNLYDLLVDFLDINDIPAGPLLLRDFGLDVEKESSDHMGHKLKEITQILRAYPNLNFVLIGDSGQDDPKIYREVVATFPGRILGIYIRDVQLADKEKIAVDIATNLIKDQVEMIVVDNTIEAAEHAAKIGLIYTDTIPQIIVDKRQDKGEISGKEQLSENN